MNSRRVLSVFGVAAISLAVGFPLLTPTALTAAPQGRPVTVPQEERARDVEDEEEEEVENEEELENEPVKVLNACGATGGKIAICHVPPGNPSKAKTLNVNVNAWRAHEAHGDRCGPCS